MVMLLLYNYNYEIMFYAFNIRQFVGKRKPDQSEHIKAIFDVTIVGDCETHKHLW
jgi:hypothetical protein